MSRKHFTAIARAIAQIPHPEARKLACEALARVCATMNPRFKRERFLTACNVDAS